MKKYEFDYNHMEAEAHFDVDTKKFTEEDAKMLLEFFTWEYDHENDPVNEYMKKLAIECIAVSTFNDYNVMGVTSEFENKEGYPKLDGSVGIELTHVQPYEFDEEALYMKCTIA